MRYLLLFLSLPVFAQAPNPNEASFRDQEIHLTGIQLDAAIQDDCKRGNGKVDITKYEKVWAAAKPELKIAFKGPVRYDATTKACTAEYSVTKAGTTKTFRTPMSDEDKLGKEAAAMMKAAKAKQNAADKKAGGH